MDIFKNIGGFTIAGICMGILLSCSATLNPNKFTDGKNKPKAAPELTVSAVGSFNAERESILNVDIGIDAESLIYKIHNRSLVAKTKIHLQIINEQDNTVTLAKDYNVEIRKALTSDMDDLGTHKLNKQYKLPAGRYSVRVSATDQRTDKQSLASTTTRIKNPQKDAPFLTDIQLFGYNPETNSYEIINTYGLEAEYDTLRFTVQVSVPKAIKEPMQMTSNLIRFASDTLPARPIGEANYSKSSLHYKGVNYYQEDIIQTINRKLLPNDKNVTVEFNYPILERGNYRFKIELEESSGGNEQNTRRNFGVRGHHFPILATAREKAKPLVYLMDDNRHEELLSIQDNDSLAKAVEEFWHDHIQPANKAKEVMKQYYSRVVIANKEFSNFKEGWKTDQGMIFILFGNPWIIDEDLSNETWFYSYNRLDKSKTFTFKRVKVFSEAYPFHNYILQRKFDYNNVLYQQKQLWLSGMILDTQI